MKQKILISILSLVMIAELVLIGYGASRIKTLEADLADSKTRVVEKLVVDHNSVHCER